MLQLSVLDQSTVVSGRPPGASIQESIRLARHCESLGYSRYWCAEHHNSASQAGTAPEILISAIAITTTRIRVGSAGIMLPHYASLKVAEQFRVLEAIAPGRIDMGLGRAPGSDGLTAYALNPQADTAAEHFPAQVRDILAWLAGRKLIEGHPFRDITAQPGGPTLPEVWILGSSDYGAQVAAYFGLPFCFAHFISDGSGAEQALSIYRQTYRPSERHPEPYGGVCVWAMAAETQPEAEYHILSRALSRLWRDKGIFAALPSPEEALAQTFSEAEKARLERIKERAIWGTPDVVGSRLRALAAQCGVTEVAVLTTVHDAEMRRRSYALLARELGLPADTGPADTGPADTGPADNNPADNNLADRPHTGQDI